MIATADLRAHTKADLEKMAKRLGIAVRGSMRKEELISAVAEASRGGESPRSKSGATAKAASASKAGSSKKTSGVQQNGSSKHSNATSEINKTTTKRGSAKSSKAKSKPTTAKAKATTAKGKLKAGGAGNKQAATSRPPKSSATKKRTSGTAKKQTSGTAKKQSSGDAKKRAKTSAARPQPTAAKSKRSVRSKGLQQASAEKGVAAAKTAKGKVPADKKTISAKKKPVQKPVQKPKPTNPKILKRIRELQLQRDSDKNIAFRPTLIKPPGAPEPVWEKEPRKDRVALFVRDAYWMHVSWDITRQAIDRAKAAMAEQWHSAKPIIRLLRLDGSGTTSTSETIERDIEIHGGLRNWYVEWNGESANFRAMIGYLTPQGRFHCICESNTVQTPGAGTSEAIDEHWSGVGPESEKIFALSGGYDAERDTSDLQEMLEQRLHRNLGAPALARLGAGADGPFARKNDFFFEMDIELVLFGSTVPDGYLTLNGEPVTLREDGTFVLRLPFPDRRQVLPAVACSRDGSQQRTIVVAVERNTKIMEPLETEQDTGE